MQKQDKKKKESPTQKAQDHKHSHIFRIKNVFCPISLCASHCSFLQGKLPICGNSDAVGHPHTQSKDNCNRSTCSALAAPL